MSVTLVTWPGDAADGHYLTVEDAKAILPGVRWTIGQVDSNTGHWPGVWIGHDERWVHVATITPLDCGEDEA